MRPLLLSLTLILTACAGLDTRLPDISPASLADERRTQEAALIARMMEMQQRLVDVATPVLVANADLCPRTHIYPGFKTHSLSNYPKSLHPALIRELGLNERPSVLRVAATGWADGILAPGDVIAVDGKSVSATSKALQKQLSAGRLNGETFPKPPMACNYPVRLKMSQAINAYATGRSITVTSGMMNFVEDDDELALIIGHELAHNTMGHVRKIVGNYIFSLGGTRYTRPFESEADYVGLYYLARTGRDLAGVEDFWRRLSETSPRGTTKASTHPIFSERFLRIAAGREEIAAKRAAGQPLIPNFLDAIGDAPKNAPGETIK